VCGVRTWRTTIASTLYGRDIANVFHVKADPILLADERSADDVADDVWSWLGTAYKAVLATEGTVLTVTVVEDVLDPVVTLPATAQKVVNEAGTLSTPNNLPVELTMHMKFTTGVPLRGAVGGMFLPPPLASTFLSSDGLSFLTSGAYWTAAGTLASTLLSGHDWNATTTPAGHESLIVYSRTRRQRGETNYFFDVNAAVRNPLPTWLRSRVS
jgi:hypothetical protein